MNSELEKFAMYVARQQCQFITTTCSGDPSALLDYYAKDLLDKFKEEENGQDYRSTSEQ